MGKEAYRAREKERKESFGEAISGAERICDNKVDDGPASNGT